MEKKDYLQLAKRWNGVSILELQAFISHLSQQQILEVKYSRPLPFSQPVAYTVIACDQEDMCLVLNAGQVEVMSVSAIQEQSTMRSTLPDRFSEDPSGDLPGELVGHKAVRVIRDDGVRGYLLPYDRYLIFLYDISDPSRLYPEADKELSLTLYDSKDPSSVVTSATIPAGDSLQRGVEEGTLLASIFKYTDE